MGNIPMETIPHIATLPTEETQENSVDSVVNKGVEVETFGTENGEDTSQNIAILSEDTIPFTTTPEDMLGDKKSTTKKK